MLENKPIEWIGKPNIDLFIEAIELIVFEKFGVKVKGRCIGMKDDIKTSEGSEKDEAQRSGQAS